MLEFYQAYTDYRGLMDLTCELLKQLAIDATGGTVVEYQGQQLDFGNVRRYTIREALVEFWPAPDRPSLDQVRDPAWLALHSSRPSPGEMLVDLFERHVEEHLFQPTIIYEYPVEVSPLAKQNPDDPSMTDRFEVFAAGMEIGNAFTELNDPNEQRRRFEMQLAMRERGDEEAHQMDEDYLRALCYPRGPSALPICCAQPRPTTGGSKAPRMLEAFELFVAARYLKAKRRQTVISLITVISVVGVAAGVLQGLLAVHHGQAGALAQGFHVGRGNFWHGMYLR